jgi:hypothetical protein
VSLKLLQKEARLVELVCCPLDHCPTASPVNWL